MVNVFVNNLEFYAYHGVPDAEQAIGHRYMVDLEALIESKATHTDRVEDTLDYGQLARVIVETATQHQFRTVERLAQVISENLLSEFPGLLEGTLSISKPMPPMPFIASEAGIRLHFERSE